MRVLVTGAAGQLGVDTVDYCRAAGDDVVALTHADLDVADEAQVVAAVMDHGPQVVVHAAAWTDVDGCEADPVRAHAVNALGAWWVARACRRGDATMVMLSTDYVFSGNARPRPDGSPIPWTEFDPVAAINAYGRSKAAGEQLVRQTLRRRHVVRTAWVCGARGHNFVRRMLEVGRARGTARVVNDQIGSPTFTRDLAAALREVAVSGRYGTWHRTNTGTCSWYDLAVATYDLAGLDVDVAPCTSAEWPRPAPRPAYSVLSQVHATAAGLTPLPPWRDGLTRMLIELEELEEVPAGRGDP